MAAAVAGLTGGLDSLGHCGRFRQSSVTKAAPTQSVNLSNSGPSVRFQHPILAFGQPICRRYNHNSQAIKRKWKVFAYSGTVSSDWNAVQSPYETLGVPRDADVAVIRAAYRTLVKRFHPDVYDAENETLEEGETIEDRFVRIQAAYELLSDPDQRQDYDIQNRTNPLKASKAWRDWVIRKKKAFEQRGDMALSAWAEQQHREMSLRARQLSKAKTDPEEERRLYNKEKKATIQSFERTLKRHTLVLKKRDIEKQRAEEEAKKRLVADLLELEGFELDE